jgi:hypothetical protein
MKRCSRCKTALTLNNTSPSIVARGTGCCRVCIKKRAEQFRRSRGVSPKRSQRPGEIYAFPCGCQGSLPAVRGENNKFARSPSGREWICRASNIIRNSQQLAKIRNYNPIDPNTPHSVIRAFMDDPLCERCKQPLNWEFKRGKTPHLHHDHETGEIYGFTHSQCNPKDLELEIERLRKLLAA